MGSRDPLVEIVRSQDSSNALRTPKENGGGELAKNTHSKTVLSKTLTIVQHTRFLQ